MCFYALIFSAFSLPVCSIVRAQYELREPVVCFVRPGSPAIHSAVYQSIWFYYSPNHTTPVLGPIITNHVAHTLAISNCIFLLVGCLVTNVEITFMPVADNQNARCKMFCKLFRCTFPYFLHNVEARKSRGHAWFEMLRGGKKNHKKLFCTFWPYFLMQSCL